jgi:hypothetical protein
MSLKPFGVNKGIELFEGASENSVVIITGSGTPDTSADFTSAETGSLYIRRGTGEFYQKSADTGAASDWVLQQATIGTWRPEKIRVLTGDTGVTSGVARDLTATPFSDDEGTQLTAADFTIGEYAIIDNTLLEVTDVSVPNVTFTDVDAQLALSESDTFVAVNYLPDSGGDQEGQAIVTYNGSAMVKIADIDWNFADGINLASGYTAGSGDVTSADTVQSAIQKIDGNNDAQDTLLGTSQGDTDLGTFSGNTISDNNTVKGALQEIELAQEEVDQNVNDLVTLSGVPENSTDLGTFTGSVISDNTTVKNALQELEAKDEAQDLVIAEIDQNVDDLITLSGVAENSTNLGAFTGFGSILLTATETVKSAIQKITDFLGNLRSVEVTGITTATVVDQVPVASVGSCVWHVLAFEEATPANRRSFTVSAVNDSSVADFSEYATLKLGSTNANFSRPSVDISGGNMRLLVESNSTAGITVRARRVAVEDI